jgi:hypothetical protein
VNDKRLLQPALAMLGALASLAASCAAQPPVKCTAANNPGVSVFTLVSSTGDCTGAAPFVNKGEVIGVYTYVPSVSDPNSYTLPNSVSFQSEEASLLAQNGEGVDPPVADTDPNHHLWALGKFDDSFPDSNDICRVSQLSPAEVNLPVVPAHMGTDDDGNPVQIDEQPATHIKYVWSNVRIIVNADSIGTQTFADLDYTRDACNATFKVSLLTPQVDCGTDGMPDQSKCDAPTDVAIGAVAPGQAKCTEQGGSFWCLPIKTDL